MGTGDWKVDFTPITSVKRRATANSTHYSLLTTQHSALSTQHSLRSTQH
ncbi:hypothetical protein H6G36_17485 [Anabaena minutissima FACHB-250]|nr:hypothetical protein [Anabaena minutissima FACHB-250]